MNLDEFKTWYKAHTRKFSNVQVWFNDQGKRKREMWDEWFRELSNISLEDALGATAKMYDSERLRNEYPQNHPAKIRELVTGISPFRDDADAEKCMCHGTGLVDVVNNGTFKTPLGNVIRAETVTVACICNRGQALHKNHVGTHSRDPKERPKPIVQFNPEWMVTWEEHLRRKGNGMIVYDPEVTQKVASGWGSLPEYQPELYGNREPGEEG